MLPVLAKEIISLKSFTSWIYIYILLIYILLLLKLYVTKGVKWQVDTDIGRLKA